jgi:hypothetical protein
MLIAQAIVHYCVFSFNDRRPEYFAVSINNQRCMHTIMDVGGVLGSARANMKGSRDPEEFNFIKFKNVKFKKFPLIPPCPALTSASEGVT